MSLHNHPWNRWPDVQPLSPADLARLAPGVGNARHYPMKTPNWKPFFFESNQFFDTLEIPGDWARLRHAYADLSNAQLLDAREATYGGHRAQSERDARPNYGFRHEHDGERTLRDFFVANGMLKYALFEPCDQTIAYFMPDGSMTTKHAEAHLYPNREEAEAKMREWGLTPDDVEEVPDEAEFRARPDTW